MEILGVGVGMCLGVVFFGSIIVLITENGKNKWMWGSLGISYLVTFWILPYALSILPKAETFTDTVLYFHYVLVPTTILVSFFVWVIENKT